MGGRHSKPARGGLPSHFASAMAALVWRSPTTSELCNSHRDKEHSSAARDQVAARPAARTLSSVAWRVVIAEGLLGHAAVLRSPPLFSVLGLRGVVHPRRSPSRWPSQQRRAAGAPYTRLLPGSRSASDEASCAVTRMPGSTSGTASPAQRVTRAASTT